MDATASTSSDPVLSPESGGERRVVLFIRPALALAAALWMIWVAPADAARPYTPTIGQPTDGTSDSFVYNRLDLASATDRLHRTTTYAYHGDRRMTSMTDPSGHQTFYAYNGLGEVTSRTDPKGNEVAPQPSGPFRLLAGSEYSEAGSAADNANRAVHAADPTLKGMQIHEVQPVKFGGSPTDLSNKIPRSPSAHSQVTTWWATLLRALRG